MFLFLFFCDSMFLDTRQAENPPSPHTIKTSELPQQQQQHSQNKRRNANDSLLTKYILWGGLFFSLVGRCLISAYSSVARKLSKEKKIFIYTLRHAGVRSETKVTFGCLREPNPKVLEYSGDLCLFLGSWGDKFSDIQSLRAFRDNHSSGRDVTKSWREQFWGISFW